MLKSNRINKKTKVKIIFLFVLMIFLCWLQINSTVFFRLKLANYYEENKNYKKAIAIYNKVLRKDKIYGSNHHLTTEDIAAVRFKLANLLLQNNNLKDSVQVISTMVEENPLYDKNEFLKLANTIYYKKFSLILLKNKLYDIAIKQMEKALQLNDRDVIGHYQLGLIYQKFKFEEKADQQFKKSIELSVKTDDKLPDYLLSDVYCKLAEKFIRKSSFDQAEAFYKKAIEVNSNNVQACILLLSLYERQENGAGITQIESRLFKTLPKYEVNYNISDKLYFLGYSLNEQEFELFNEGLITFFWEIKGEAFELDNAIQNQENIKKTGRRIYSLREVKNLVPSFGFEADEIGTGFPSGWETDAYGGLLESHEVILEERLSRRTSCLMLDNTISSRTNCQTAYLSIEKNTFYLQAGWMKSINGNAFMGRAWFDPEKKRISYSYAAENITFSEWEYYSQIVLPPINTVYSCLWLTNLETKGKAYFDNILFVQLDAPVKIDKEL